jgi:hypothetical protein
LNITREASEEPFLSFTANLRVRLGRGWYLSRGHTDW